MTWSDIGTWLGTAFSIIGAAIAIWQARQAKASATRAETIRNEIAENNEQIELAGLDTILAGACRAMDKYGPGAGSIKRRGASPEGDASAVRTLTASLDRHRDLLEDAFGKICVDFRDRVNDLLGEFGSATSDADRLEIGKEIYLELTILSGHMKRALDRRTFGNSPLGPRVRLL